MDLYAEAKKYPVLTHNEEIEIAKQFKTGDKVQKKAARDALINHNLRLVYKIATEFQNTKTPIDDLIQEGTIGLICAINKYDWERGFKFSTYAVYWIRQRMIRYLYQYSSGGLIKIPSHVGQLLRQVQTTEKNLAVKLERDPSIDEVAAALNIPKSKIEQVKRVTADHYDYNGKLDDGDQPSISFDNVLEDKTAADPADLYEKEELRQIVNNILMSLKPKDRQIIMEIYGLIDGDPKTLSEVGELYDVSRERIRQIKVRALSKFNTYSKRKMLKDFY